MNKTTQLMCAHSALLFAVLLGAGAFFVTGWLPPVNPALTAGEIAKMFLEDQTRIRIGVSIMALASVLWWTLSAVISVQLRRIEGEHHPLTYVNLGAASGTVLAIILPAYIWLAMAYRPGAVPAETIQLANDLSWLMFIGAYPPGLLQVLAIGICVLSDKRAVPVFSRWVGYANVWIAVLFLPGALLPFFKTGPFTWTGVIGFWLVATAFFGWVVMMWWATVRAVKMQEV